MTTALLLLSAPCLAFLLIRAGFNVFRLPFLLAMGNGLVVIYLLGAHFGKTCAAVGFVVLAFFGLLVLGLCWAASGSPDVNGDVDRDARDPLLTDRRYRADARAEIASLSK